MIKKIRLSLKDLSKSQKYDLPANDRQRSDCARMRQNVILLSETEESCRRTGFNHEGLPAGFEWAKKALSDLERESICLENSAFFPFLYHFQARKGIIGIIENGGSSVLFDYFSQKKPSFYQTRLRGFFEYRLNTPVVGINAANYTAFAGTLTHELAHCADYGEYRVYPFSKSRIFERLTGQMSFSRSSGIFNAQVKALRGGIDQKKYPAESYEKELFARLASKYVVMPERFKSEMPLLTDYFDNVVGVLCEAVLYAKQNPQGGREILKHLNYLESRAVSEILPSGDELRDLFKNFKKKAGEIFPFIGESVLKSDMKESRRENAATFPYVLKTRLER